MKKIALNLCLIIMIALTFGFANISPVKAESEILNIVALGDSITTGYLLGDSTDDATTKQHPDLFVNKIAMSKNAVVTNLAVSGDKAEDLYQIIIDSNNNSTVVGADCFIITIGGNDILQPILDKFSELLRKDLSQASEEEIGFAFFQLINDSTLLSTLDNAIINFDEEFEKVAQTLRNKNSQSQIIFQTVYNPAAGFDEDAILGNLYNFVNDYILDINKIINNSEYKTLYGYEVCDTYTIFEEDTSGRVLTNINQFDIHPSSDGHDVIANSLAPLIRDKEILKEITTIKIYTNNIYVNDPTDTSEGEKLIGGYVADTTRDELGYEIFEVPVNGTKTLNISTNQGYKLTGVKFGEENQILSNKYDLNGKELPNTISIYFLQEFTLTYSIGYYGNIIVDSELLDNPAENITKQVLYGAKSVCTITADYSYEIDKVTIDGEVVEFSGINYNFENIIQNHTFNVTFKKIEKTFYVNPIFKIELEGSTDSIAYGTVLNVSMVVDGDKYKEITESIDIYSNKFKIYDLSLKYENLVVQPNGNFTLRIPLPENFDKEKTELYYVSDTNEQQILSYTLDENNMMVFQTDHCSYYVVVERGVKPKSYWWVYVIVGAVILIATTLTIVLVIKKKQDAKIQAEIQAKAQDDYFSY